MMLTQENEPIYRQSDGNYIINVNGDRYGVCDNNPVEKYTISMVESYLIDHPEALIPEPVPPPPTGEELAARRVAEAKAYLASTDWVIAKIGEAQMLGQDIAPLISKYTDELAGRAAARTVINTVEAI